MKPFKILLVAMVIGLIVWLIIEQQAREKLRAENNLLQQQLAQLQSDNENFSNQLAQTKNSQSLSDDKLNELLKLRGEVGVLEHQTNELGNLRAENLRLQNAQREVATQKATADAQEQQRQMAIQKMDNAKQIDVALAMFAGDHQNNSPTNLDQIASYFDSTNWPQKNFPDFEITFQGSRDSITNPSQIIVLREKQAWQSLNGNWLKTYGFADGHSEVHSEPNGNFDNWESQHMIPPPGQ